MATGHRKIKTLHNALNLEQLNESVCPENMINQIKSSSAKSLCNTASKLLKSGDENYNDGDDEVAYIHYMRYIQTMKTLREKPEYQKDNVYYNNLLGPNKLKGILERCEEIGKNLQYRYSQREEIERVNLEVKKAELMDATAEDNKRQAIMKAGGKNGLIFQKLKPNVDSGGGMSVVQLKNLIEQKTARFLVIDCRFGSDYARSHLDNSYCISIPKEKLVPGSSAQKIQEELNSITDNKDTAIIWSKRDQYDLLILYDWNSSFESRNPTEAISILYDAITKWDPETKYKEKPYILQGGIRNLYYTYPQLLNNPVGVQEDVTSKRVDPSKALQTIFYPSWEDGNFGNSSTNSRAGKSPSPIPNFPTIHSLPNNIMNNGDKNDFSTGRIDTIEIDRSSKPIRKHSSKVITNEYSNVSLNNFPKMNGLTSDSLIHNHSTENKKVNEIGENMCVVLDEVIKGVEDAVKNEEEWKKMFKDGSIDSTYADTLQEKENIIERQAKELERTRIEFDKLKLDYEDSLRREKSTLPKIRATPVQTILDEKFKKKIELDEYVKKLREERKLQKEGKNKRLNEMKSNHVSGYSMVNNHNNNVNNRFGAEYNFPDSEDESLGGASFPSTLKMSTSSTTSFSRPTEPKPSSSNSSSATTIGRPPNESAPIPITSTRLRDDDGAPRNSLLKRSHSNPNFAQSLPDDMDINSSAPTEPTIPGINRAQKPQSIVKRREFNTIASSNFHSQSDSSRTGLKNLGNTCYMNSIMQCLNHTHHLVDYILKQRKTKDDRFGLNMTRGEITAEVSAAIMEMNLGHRSISLFDLKNVLTKKRPNFKPLEQQDSHEFLTVILQSMHEEMVNKSLAEKDVLPNLDKLPDEEAGEITWNRFMRTEATKISQLFGGQYRSTVECSNCGHCSVTFDTFFVLTVPMPNASKKCTINQCIDLSSVEEEVSDFKCVACKKQGKAFKRLDIWRLPPYLIIHLQRFYFDGYWKKRMGEVEFPIDHLEVTSKLKAGRYDEGSSQISRFQLYGISNHYGTMEGGHYTAYCRRTNWSKYDDQDVSIIASRDVGTAAAYILFYKNRDCDILLDPN